MKFSVTSSVTGFGIARTVKLPVTLPVFSPVFSNFVLRRCRFRVFGHIEEFLALDVLIEDGRATRKLSPAALQRFGASAAPRICSLIPDFGF